MEHYVGLDVSLRLTAICIVDQTGRIGREGVVASNPEAIAHSSSRMRPRSKVVGAQSLGHPACEAKRAAQSQGCRRSKACRHSAPDVDRRNRVQLVDKEGRRVTRNKEITEFPRGREKTSLPGRWRW